MENVIAQHITKTPGICGGRPCIAGHRIRVQDIVVWHEMRGYCPDEIVDMFPGITLADVYAALAYYFDHREEIEHTRKLIVTSCRAGVLRDVSNAIPARRDKSKNRIMNSPLRCVTSSPCRSPFPESRMLNPESCYKTTTPSGASGSRRSHSRRTSPSP